MRKIILSIIFIIQLLSILSVLWQLVGFPGWFDLLRITNYSNERIWVAIAIKLVAVLISLSVFFIFGKVKKKYLLRSREREILARASTQTFDTPAGKNPKESVKAEWIRRKIKRLISRVSSFRLKELKWLSAAIYFVSLGRIFTFVPWVAHFSNNSRVGSLDQGYSLFWEPPVTYATVDMGRVFLAAMTATVVFGVFMLLVLYVEQLRKNKL